MREQQRKEGRDTYHHFWKRIAPLGGYYNPFKTEELKMCVLVVEVEFFLLWNACLPVS